MLKDNLTGKNSPPLPLLTRSAPGLAVQSERCLVHEPADVVSLLKLCLSVVQLRLVEERRNMRHLYVG